MNNIVLPQLGEDIQSATVALWHYKVGDPVVKDDDLVELVTDKASFNVPSPNNGILQEVFFTEGQIAKIGAVLGTIQSKEKS